MTTKMLLDQFDICEKALRLNTDDLTHREACLAPSPGGSSINWIVGHVLANRNTVLRLLGEEPIWSKNDAARFGRGSEPPTDPQSAIPFDKMRNDLEASQLRIVRGLERIGATGLAEPAPSEVAGKEEKSIGVVLAFFSFHEAYHVGQSGIIRRLIGKEGAIR